MSLTNLTSHGDDGSVVAIMMVLNLYDAKAQLSSLVEEAARGREIIIAKAGKPKAKLVPVRPAVRRRPGRAKGKIWMSADFDAPLPAALLEAFAGGKSE